METQEDLRLKYLPKKKSLVRKDKWLTSMARVLNPLLVKFRFGIVYRDGKWKFDHLTTKPRKIRHTYVDDVRNWTLDGAGPLPLDDNAARRLMDNAEPLKASSKKKFRKQKPRRYISPEVGVEGLFAKLNDAGIRYAALRWFDKLPVVDPGEDIDMLFEDDAMDRLDEFFIPKRVKGAVPCDIYSEGGLPGTAFEGLPYYESRLASQILSNTVLEKGLFKVPDTKHHFLSLAYHVVYHKAHTSGLSFMEGEVPLKDEVDHDYAQVLGDLADQLGIKVEMTMKGLRKSLEDFNWNPAVDTIRKLSGRRPIIRRFLDTQDNLEDGVNICTFVVRQWAYDKDLLAWITANLRCYGFDIKLVHVLNADEQERARANIRGGNWNQGPYPISGGPPAALIVACDYAPEPPDEELLLKQPYVTNYRFVIVKELLRKGINKYLPGNLRVNGVHSADDNLESWNYLEEVCPELIPQVSERIAKGYEGDPYLKLKLHMGRRAHSYLVYRDGKPCVLKIFADSEMAISGYENEKLASQLFAGKAWAPDWIDVGPNWILQRLFDQRNRLDRLVPSMSFEEREAVAGKIIEMISDIHASGYAHRDVHALNIFMENGQPKLIDFETIHPQDKSIPLAQSYDISGEGIPSPFGTGQMCYTKAKRDKALSAVLNVPFEKAAKLARK